MSEHRLPALLAPLTAEQIATKMATGHSVFSPSASEMTMTCEQSLVLNTLAEDRQTYEAAEGTVAHALAEEWLKTGERPDERIGEIVEIKTFEIEITEEMLGFVEDFVDLCESTKEGSDYYATETHVDISHLTPIPEQGGTADWLAFRPGKMTIIDLKYGKEPVDAVENKQLRVYASGVFQEWDWLYGFQEIEIVICQPRLPIGVSRWTITRDELLAFDDFARERWQRAWRPLSETTRTPSLKGCRWCSERAKCPALYLFMANLDDVFEDHDALEAKDMVIEGQYTVVEMEKANDFILDDLEPTPFPNVPNQPELSTEALAKLLRFRKLMENFFNAVEAELLDRAISKEEEIPLWKLVESRTRRKLVDDEEHVVTALEAKGLKRKYIFETKIKSPAALERELHTRLKMPLNKAKAWLEEAGLTVKPPGQKTLAAVSDARKALPKDGDVFENWDDQDSDDI